MRGDLHPNVLWHGDLRNQTFRVGDPDAALVFPIVEAHGETPDQLAGIIVRWPLQAVGCHAATGESGSAANLKVPLQEWLGKNVLSLLFAISHSLSADNNDSPNNPYIVRVELMAPDCRYSGAT